MNGWIGFTNVLEQLTWMGIALGIIGYFFFREWSRRRENIAMMERMTPEQLADIRRVDAEIEAERKRNSSGNLWFLRLGMAVIGGGAGLLLGMQLFAGQLAEEDMGSMSIVPVVVFKIIATTLLGIGLFIFLEFLIELYLRRMERSARSRQN